MKDRTQLSGESLQDFAATIEQLANWALVGLREYCMRRGRLYFRQRSEESSHRLRRDDKIGHELGTEAKAVAGVPGRL
jgi:hypothetical protein